jgi:hypothetical protein
MTCRQQPFSLCDLAAAKWDDWFFFEDFLYVNLDGWLKISEQNGIPSLLFSARYEYFN